MLEDDTEAKTVLHDAAITMMPRQLRRLFVDVLLHLIPDDPSDFLHSKVAGCGDLSLWILMSQDFANNRCLFFFFTDFPLYTLVQK